ncbi:MAG: glycoside hydrolase family 43 protein [Anaerolineae bacterium]|nr:glycoside hydrolase family 43 protein [Anaerolineae bacterium]
MSKTYRNPILPGFYPDPSICRVGEDYYMVNSTFEYFPGLPIFHSRDLVHWRQIGHALDRPSQLPLDEVRPSGGLYAPTIRFHDGMFYVINTLVAGTKESGNFIVTATDPAGPWSEPYWLKDAPGIDPSLLFDDDGRVWYTGNRVPPQGEQYHGHREIWLQELDLQTMQLVGEKYALYDGMMKDSIHAEAPHLYKINGWYYLLIAEGGTSHNHAVTIARSQTITGPYVNNPRNPILTHRHLGQDHPITGTGHADIVETQNGEWWLVCLAMRPYGGRRLDSSAFLPEGDPNEDHYFNLGRETFMAPVIWEHGWPIVSLGSGKIEFEYPLPNLPEHLWPARPICDNFESERLDDVWNFLRTPRDDFYSLTERPGCLRLRLRPQKLSEWANPSFVGRRQQHINFMARTAMDFTPTAPNEEAGIVLLQNSDFHFRFVVIAVSGDKTLVRLIKRERGAETILAECPIANGRVYLKVEAYGQAYNFYAATTAETWLPVAEGVDGRILSTTVAGGFVGAYLGMYASSNGQPSNAAADFDWFEYAETGS